MASAKEKAWLEEYFVDFNATAAARRVGYKSPNVRGPEKKTKFAEEIKARLDEKVMTADEALAELSDMARLDLSPYVYYARGLILVDTDELKAAGLGPMIKGVKNTRDGPQVEFYDKQRALEMIAKHHGLLTDHVDVTSDGQQVMVYVPHNERQDE